MSTLNLVLLASVLALFTELIRRIAKRRQQEQKEFEAKLARLFNEVRSDKKNRFARFIPKDHL